jgi:hypothetical protein
MLPRLRPLDKTGRAAVSMGKVVKNAQGLPRISGKVEREPGFSQFRKVRVTEL